jgi:protein gp37
MSDNTGIEWTHVPGYTGATWNPVRGCTKVSPGCKHCYAETFAERWRGVAGHPYEQGFDLRLVPEKLDEPLRAMKPRAYFVNSMSDLHQDGVPLDFLRTAYAVMQATMRHLYMVLTKRPENMLDAVCRMMTDGCITPAMDFLDGSTSFERGPSAVRLPNDGGALPAPYLDRAIPDNVWLGVSVEDRKFGVPRIDVLREIPAAVRFLSIEPLLEDLGDLDLRGIDWVIVGGESGRKARPFAEEWAVNIVRQCKAQDVPVFVKQPGDAPTSGGSLVQVRSKSDRSVLARWGIDIREWPKVIQRRQQAAERAKMQA